MTEYKFQVSDKIGDKIFLYRGNTLEELDNARDDMLYHLGMDKDAKVAPPSGTPNSQQNFDEPVTTQTQQSNGETQSIPVEQIVYSYTSKNGDHCWKVKGGWAKEWGISAWHDVFESANIDWTKLPVEPNQVYVPNGDWIAKYIEWEGKDRQGNPQTQRKVVKLEFAG